MDLRLQKGTSVSLHQQLVTQLAMQIASGVIQPGTKLPSIRALAQKLDVHHNTCLSAYKELDEGGLIELRHGSGAHVKVLPADQKIELLPMEQNNLETLADFFVRQALKQGYRWETALSALEAAYRQNGQAAYAPLVFVDIHADILPVFQAELQQALKRPVRAVLIEDVDQVLESNIHFVVSRYHCEALHKKLQELYGGTQTERQLRDRVTVVEVGSVQQELSLIRQLSPEALVSVVSASTIILQQAEAVVKALRGEDIIIRTILTGQESASEIQRVLKRTQAVFADVTCAAKLQEMTRKPVNQIQIIPAYEMNKLSVYAIDV
jgi:DNA-binding transcriptional regulator YhcF (GntR family)